MTHQETIAYKRLSTYFGANYEALQNAALLLGGAPALRLVQSLFEEFSLNVALTRMAKRNLVELHKVLSLHYVDDPERLEHGLFAEIEPMDPVVEDICLLTDDLLDHLRAIDEASSVAVFDLNIEIAA